MELVKPGDVHQEAWTRSQGARVQGKVVGPVGPEPSEERKWSFLSGLATPGVVGLYVSLKTLEEIEESVLWARAGKTTTHGLF